MMSGDLLYIQGHANSSTLSLNYSIVRLFAGRWRQVRAVREDGLRQREAGGGRQVLPQTLLQVQGVQHDAQVSTI